MTDTASDPSTLGRRAFLWSTAVAAAAPIMTEATLAHAKLASQRMGVLPPDAVIINANENPLGPSKAALEAITKIAPLGGRYDRTGIQATFVNTYAAQHGLKPENVAVYAGSSEPLRSRRCTISTAPAAPMTASSAVGHAKARSAISVAVGS